MHQTEPASSVTEEHLRLLVEKGRFREALELGLTQADNGARVLAAYAAYCLGNHQLASEILEQVPPFADKVSEVGRLGLLGRIRYNAGRLEEYHQIAQQAIRIDVNAITLYHLGQSLPPDQAVLVLKESLAQATTPQDEGQAAYALSRVLEKLGRYREALSYASLALLRSPNDPVVLIGYAGLVLVGGDGVALDNLEQPLLPMLSHPEFNYRWAALHLLAGIALAREDLAGALHWSELLLEQVGKDMLPLFVWQMVRIYLTAQQQERALQVARAAALSTLADPTFRGLTHLALGQALYPRPEAEATLREAANILEEAHPGAALIARAYLASLHRQPLEPEDLALLDQWSPALRKSLPADLPLTRNIQEFTLYTLGQGELHHLQGPVSLRPRSLELLVLLLSRPQGWERQDLELALYGQPRPNALRVELVRLKQGLNGGLSPRSWQVTAAIGADFQDLLGYLANGDVKGVLTLYQGSLLPRSTAPGIEELRRILDEEVKDLVLGSPNPADLFRLAELFAEDLEVWEKLLAVAPKNDPRYFAVRARVNRLRQAYQT